MSRIPYAALCLVLLLIACVGNSFAQTASSGGATAVSASTGASSDQVVLKVGDTRYTKTQFDDIFADYWKATAGGPVQQRKSIGESFASALVLSKKALADGLEKDPEVQRQLEAARIQVLSNAEYDRLEKKAQPTQTEIAAYYDSHLDDFDEVYIRRLFVYKLNANSNGHGLPAAEAKAKAEQIRKVLAAGGDATPLIKGTQDMLDAEPLNFKRGELPGPMAQAFDMKVGEWSQVADTPDALLFFQVVKKERISLALATPTIQKRLEAIKLRAELQALKDKTGVWMDDEYFSGPLTASKGETPSSSSEKQAPSK